MTAFEENEVSKNAHGGTEIAKRRLSELIDPELQSHFQVIPSRIRELNPEKIRILWCHDLPRDPEVQQLRDENFRNQFHAIVFISNWQYQQYQDVLGIGYNHMYRVLESAIDRVDDIGDIAKPAGPKITMAYTSTPQRGLGILLGVFDKIWQTDNDLHLDVFSSFKIYGWNEPKEFEHMYEFIRSHPGMTYHGFKPNDEVRKALRATHIHAYPSTWPETSCRAMLEAMSAGCLCVHPNFAGLTDTSGGLNFMYAGDQDPQTHAGRFNAALTMAVQLMRENSEFTQARLKFNKGFVDTRFNVKVVSDGWSLLMKELVERYPTVESRKPPEAMFRVKTA